MAPRGKKNASSRRNATENETDFTSASPNSFSSSSSSSRSASQRGKTAIVSSRSTRRSTRNATNLTQAEELKLDMSEDSDFDTISNAGPSTIRPHHAKDAANTNTTTATAITSNAKKRSAENQSSSANKLKQKKLVKQDSDLDMNQTPIKEEDTIETPMGSGSDGGSEFRMDEDQSSEDEDEWEEVSVSAIVQEQQGKDYIGEEEEEEEEELSGPWQYNAVEIVFDKPLSEIKTKSKNKGITKEERIIRILIHQTHLLCLIANGLQRNRWIGHPKLSSVALSLVPGHIAEFVQEHHKNPTRELNALQVLALWWRDSFVVTGPGIQHHEYMDIDVVGPEAVFPTDGGEYIKQRKNLQRKLLNRSGSTDVCSQLFTAICRSLGLKTRLIESLQACSFKISPAKEGLASLVKDEAEASSSKSVSKKGKKKKEIELDESDTTRGSRVVLHTPHRLTKKAKKLPHNHKSADPPVFWTEVYSACSKKWIPIDPVRGYVNSPLKLHPPSSCSTNVLAYVVAYDEENYVTDVTRRYTSTWGTTTKKLRVQPAGSSKFDWWSQTMSGLTNPHRTVEKDLEEEELLTAEISERMPTRLGDFNNHPLYALERHLKKFEVLHPRIPVLGHIRGEAVYPRSCVKQVRSKENWLRKGRVVKSDESKPIKWVKSHAATIFQIRLRQQRALSGEKRDKEDLYTSNQLSNVEEEEGKGNVDDESAGFAEGDAGVDKIPLFGEWQTEAYQPPWVIDGKVPRNQYGRQDVFTPEMVPIGGTHLKGRGIGKVAKLLGVDYVEAVTGFEFLSRKSVPVTQGIIVPTEHAELVLDAYYQIEHQRDQEAHKKRRTEVLKRWRKLIKGLMIKSRLVEEYGEEEQDEWVPDDDNNSDGDEGRAENRNRDLTGETTESVDTNEESSDQNQTQAMEVEDSGAGFMLD
ncbi:hypothetical protein BGZ49_004991 [Haplosporangium sp. Z 27]|nr:hypothetical protein BGZ49_004991 [Haplosporangium sp. Z 27]